MNQLQGQTGFDPRGRLAAPARQQVPGSQAEVLGDQHPQADHVAGDFVGQQLANASFQTSRIGGLDLDFLFGSVGINADQLSLGVILIEFFFGDQTQRKPDPHCVC